MATESPKVRVQVHGCGEEMLCTTKRINLANLPSPDSSQVLSVLAQAIASPQGCVEDSWVLGFVVSTMELLWFLVLIILKTLLSLAFTQSPFTLFQVLTLQVSPTATCVHLHSSFLTTHPLQCYTKHLYFKCSLRCLVLVPDCSLTAWEMEAGGSSLLGNPGQHNVLWINLRTL